jgi:hypothetical protein
MYTVHQFVNKITISLTLIFSTRITVVRKSIKAPRRSGVVALIARSLAIRVAKCVRLQRCSSVSYSCRCTVLDRVAASGLAESSHLQGPFGNSTRPHSLSATGYLRHSTTLDRPSQGRTHFPCPVDPSLHLFPNLHLYFPIPAWIWVSPGEKIFPEHSLSHVCKIVFGKRLPVTRKTLTRAESGGSSSNGTIPSSADATAIQPHRTIGCRTRPFTGHGPHVASRKVR